MTNPILNQLCQICGQDNVLDNPQLTDPYTHDWRKRYHGSAIAVVFPETQLQIQELVRFCQAQQIAIIPQGGNTSTCGAATPLSDYARAQLIINLQRMNQIISLDRDNYSLTVEAGCTLQQVQEYASAHGLYFPLSLASQGSCQIGGNLATNAGGVQVLKYGMIRDLTLGLRAVLANGEVLDGLTALRKDNTYLELKQLLIGSEGTLGIITHATFKLFPMPPAYCTLMFPVSSIAQALQLLQALKTYYTNNVSAFEIIKRDSWQIYQNYFDFKHEICDAPWSIICEIEINNDFVLENLLTLLEQNEIDLSQSIVASSEQERQYLWQLREQIPLAEKQHGYAAKHDISLPLSQLEDFVASNSTKLKKLEPCGYFSIFGHLGDGNLHYNFGLAGADSQQIRELEQLVNPLVYNDIIVRGGSISAEHGIGQSKNHWLQQFCDPVSYQLMQQLKQQLDPSNLLNPGKIFNLPETDN
jgi:FAD/FMN-containing dehydrogenase